MNYQPALVQLPLVCESKGQKVTSPADVQRLCCDIAGLAQESFHVLCLNAKNNLLNRSLVTLGLADSTPVHPREVFRAAVQEGASAVVLAHNHPTGDPTPSAEDLRVTRQLVEAGRVLAIRVLDHVIIVKPRPLADGEPPAPGFLSLRESGLCTFDLKEGTT
jgi:DNA repair protein RadC